MNFEEMRELERAIDKLAGNDLVRRLDFEMSEFYVTVYRVGKTIRVDLNAKPES